jgi:hypothetical protein
MRPDLFSSASRPRLAGVALLVLVLAAVAMVAVPVWLIRPFVPQTPGGLAVAFVVRRWAPSATLFALVAGAALAVALWSRGRWGRRTLAALALIPLAAAAWASRVNVFEKMFSPLGGARFAPAAEAGWVAADDPVLAVERGGDAAAYPVRQVAYHHIVQDVVGGVPVAVTY